MRRLDYSLSQTTQATGLRFECAANGGTDLLAVAGMGELNFTSITN